MESELTLEIGAGHNLSSAADVVVDKFLLDNTERAGALKTICPTVIADGECLPFRDKAFARTIGRQVMEHMDDIGLFFEELMRVSSSGYLASPSYLRELAYWWSYHRWLITKEEDVLICAHKTDQSPMAGRLLHYFGANYPHFRKFTKSLPTEFLHVQYAWKEKINYRIVDRIELPDFSTDEAIEAYFEAISSQPSSSSSDSLKRWILRRFPNFAIRMIDKGRKAYHNARRAKSRAAIDLDELLVCTACKQDVRHEEKQYVCTQCGNSYPIVNGIPVFLLEDKKKNE